MAPPSLLTQVARMFPDALFYAPIPEKLIALTIDDIPTPGDWDDASTRLIVAALERYNRTATHTVRATFFVITDHLNPGSTILSDILAAGHEIANHGTTDTTPAVLSPAEFERHFQQAHELITDAIQQPLRWYRPGRGFYNRYMVEHIRLTPGYESLMALASMIPFDTMQLLSTPNLNTWYLSRFIFPGSIFVMHGGSMERCLQTAQALPPLLKLMEQQGYRVVTLSELYDSLTPEAVITASLSGITEEIAPVPPPPPPGQLLEPPSPPIA